MSCHGCTAKFSIFNKEIGCPSCGYSFCSKCLKFKAVVPKLGSSETKICKECYENLVFTKKSDSNKEYHSTSFLRKLESLDSPAYHPITVYQEGKRFERLKRGLTEEDLVIAERLEKLHADRKKPDIPSDDEIAKRLASLKGENHEISTSSKKKLVLSQADNRTDQQKSESLLKQLQQQSDLEAKDIKPEEEIATRLAKLRGEEVTEKKTVSASELGQSNSENISSITLDEVNVLLKEMEVENRRLSREGKFSDSSTIGCLKSIKANILHQESKDIDSLDDEHSTKKLIEKILAEAELEKNNGDGVTPNSDTPEEESLVPEDEFPWCVMCNEDATKRCLGCEGDLYCDGCFRESHDVFNMLHHKTIPFND